MSWQTVAVCDDHYKEWVPDGDLDHVVRSVIHEDRCQFCEQTGDIYIRIDLEHEGGGSYEIS